MRMTSCAFMLLACLSPPSLAPAEVHTTCEEKRESGGLRENRTGRIATTLAGGDGDFPESWCPELWRSPRGHHPDGGPGKARLGLQRPVSCGTGACKYPARSE